MLDAILIGVPRALDYSARTLLALELIPGEHAGRFSLFGVVIISLAFAVFLTDTGFDVVEAVHHGFHHKEVKK